MWKAEEWRGRIVRGKWCPAPMTAEDREMGLTVFDVYPEGREHCAICGAVVWHYWEFADADGETLLVGQECAKVACGDTPPARFLRDQEERRRYDYWCRAQAEEAKTRRNWWHDPKQACVRRLIVVGARLERLQSHPCTLYRTAYRLAKAGRMSDRMRAWVENCEDPVAALARALDGWALLYGHLSWVRPGRFDGPTIADLCERFLPRDDRKVFAPPPTIPTLNLIRKLSNRYRRQSSPIIESLPSQWRGPIDAALARRAEA